VTGLPPAALASVERARASARAEAAELEARRAALAAESGPSLDALARRVAGARAIVDLLRSLPCRDGSYVITGWIPTSDAAALRDALTAAASQPVVMESLPPARGRRDVPTLLRHPPWLSPFAPLVRTFGIAGYDELDPTLVTAVVFLFTYGMMFGDLGHGLLVALVGALVSRTWRFGVVIAAAGVSAMLFGALYGVAFGATVMTPLWLQPLHAIIPLLTASVMAGVAILNLGFLLHLVSSARRRAWHAFWLDRNGVTGLALYWVLIGGGVAVVAGRLPASVWLALALVPVLLLAFRDPLLEAMRGERPRFAAHALVGVFEVIEAIIGYVSNSLSFIRLGAFAVAHEGLSSMILPSAPGAGPWITFVLGTIVIVGFEGAIVAIQALRLQYFEFFGRFFGGRGRPFTPLTPRGGPDAPLRS
jgi:V/A-type H+/Na+-transporting ATPase subunit I